MVVPVYSFPTSRLMTPLFMSLYVSKSLIMQFILQHNSQLLLPYLIGPLNIITYTNDSYLPICT